MTDYPKSTDGATAAKAEKDVLTLLGMDSGAMPSEAQLAWHADEPPSLDPDHRTQSRREAGLLLAAVFSPPTSPPPESTPAERAGYAVVGQRSTEDARVHPRLAEVLAAGARDGLQHRFSDLWAVDWLTWEHLTACDPRPIATAWLSSPGRRLLSDLDVLLALRNEPSPNWEPGPTNLEPGRLRDAIGIGIGKATECQATWNELHTAIPGETLSQWAPRSRQPGVSHVITQLERGMPPMRRGAALAWLLDRAVDDPIYTIDELTRDLRQDLPVRLAAAFTTDGELAEHHRTGRRLESTLLQHVACMAATTLRDWTTTELWHLARWLHGTLVRSPWFGGDLPALVERLRAHLPKSPPSFEEPFDALHPARFRDIDDTDAEGLDPDELAIVAGALLHYGGARSGAPWIPAPRPLVQELRRIAQRSLDPGERRAEEAIAQVDHDGASLHDQVGWRTVLGPHVAPPIVARWLLSRVLHAGWMKQAISSGNNASVQEALGLLEADPLRYDWGYSAWMDEGPQLPETAQVFAWETWRRLSRCSSTPPPHWLATLGAGLLDVMRAEDLDMVIDQARAAEPRWRTHLLNVLAERLSPGTNHWNAVIDTLLSQAGDPNGADKERLESAIFAVRRLGSARRDEDHPRLQQIADLVEYPPLSRHSGLRRELRRLGFSSQRASGAD